MHSLTQKDPESCTLVRAQRKSFSQTTFFDIGIQSFTKKYPKVHGLLASFLTPEFWGEKD